MATGRFLKWLEAQIKERHVELLTMCADLIAEQRDSLLEDWDRAQALNHYELTVKLWFWRVLPYIAFGFGGDDEDEDDDDVVVVVVAVAITRMKIMLAMAMAMTTMTMMMAVVMAIRITMMMMVVVTMTMMTMM